MDLSSAGNAWGKACQYFWRLGLSSKEAFVWGDARLTRDDAVPSPIIGDAIAITERRRHNLIATLPTPNIPHTSLRQWCWWCGCCCLCSAEDAPTIVRRVKGMRWLATRAPEGSIQRLAVKAAGDKSVDDSRQSAFTKAGVGQ